ncbi:hypothetical protein [Stenotrophomonas lactitubi]|uniref:YobI family P-loop NTPase n=1 Tax=Stenotrophomonas lactitubi TaxID=2045214 RepID=UPI001E3AA258|nr:hypothetical protein [Stenotrophomonas lactitubi]
MKIPTLGQVWTYLKEAFGSMGELCRRANQLRKTKLSTPPYSARTPRQTVVLKQSLRALFGSKVYRRLGEFSPLTPARLVGEDYERYRGELLSALRFPKVRNIAVTGGYGAGKSSFIQSFAEDHSEYNYCFISLATFNSDPQGPPGKKLGAAESEDLAQGQQRDPIERIEATIVQQLLYSVKDRSIPQTRLKRINHVSEVRATGYSLLTLVICVALFRVVGLPDSYAPLAQQSPVREILGTSLWLSVAVLAVSGYWLARKMLVAALSFNIQSISLRGFSLAQPGITSVLHKQMDEIVYLFERNKIDVVFIEDLDRFIDPSPFTRLREINFIVNTSPSIRRPVHFVYLIRDDLFTAEDRVKFFDFVLPVVSVINVDNSRQKMLDIMRQRRWREADMPSEKLIEEVCYYVDDMRQLIDIVNEYDLFRELMGKNKDLDRNKVFAAVVARCLYPRQYAMLLKSEGPIYELILSYKPWAEAKLRSLDAEISNLQESISLHEVGLARTEREMRALIWMVASEYDGSQQLEAIALPSGERMAYRDFTGPEAPSGFDPAAGEINLHFSNRSIRAVSVSSLVGSGGDSLGARMGAARSISAGARKRLSSLRAKRLDEVVIGLSQAVRYPEFKSHVASVSNDLGLKAIGHLVSNGYLGEDYFDYSGFFYEGSVSKKDKGLMLSIKAGEMLPVETVVDSPAALVERLSEADLGEGRGLLIAIVSYVFESKDSQNNTLTKRQAVLRGIIDHQDRLDELLAGLQLTGALPVFVDALIQDNAAAFIEVLSEGGRCKASPLRERLCGYAVSSPHAVRERIGEGLANELDVHVTGVKDASAFLSAISSINRAKQWLDSNNTWLEEIDDGLTSKEVDTLIRMDAIDINLHNIQVMVRGYGLEWPERAFSFGDVRAMDRSRLRTHLLDSPDSLAEAVLEQDAPVFDDSSHVIWAINSVKDDRAIQRRIIAGVAFLIEDLGALDEELWQALCTYRRVRGSWKNVKSLVLSKKVEAADECLKHLLGGREFSDGLRDDKSALAAIGDDAASIAMRILSREDSDLPELAELLGSSGLIEAISDSQAPVIPSSSYAAVTTGLSGRWVSWVYYRAQSIDVSVAAKYLASCLVASPSLKIEVDIQSTVLAESLALVAEVQLRATIAAACISRVLDWSEASANAVAIAMLDHVGEGGGLADSMLTGGAGARLINAASLDIGLALLSSLVDHKTWSEIKPVVVASIDGPLSSLRTTPDQLTLKFSDASRKLANSLYRAGVVRKPAFRRKVVVLQLSAKF